MYLKIQELIWFLLSCLLYKDYLKNILKNKIQIWLLGNELQLRTVLYIVEYGPG